MTTFDRCIESLAFCHLQDEPRWAAARIVAQQDIDEFIRSSGAGLTEKLQALLCLQAAFDARFSGQIDPVLIRSYLRRHVRRIEYDLKRSANEEAPSESSDSPATIPEMDLDDRGDFGRTEASEKHQEGSEAGEKSVSD
jgi:hypothetical protein